MLLGELAKSEFGRTVNWTGLGVDFDRNTSTKWLKDTEKVEPFSTPQFSCVRA